MAQERSKIASIDKEAGTNERWESWVEDFLDARYAGPTRLKTHVRMKAAWSQWSLFLAEQAVPIPRALTYNHVLSFIAWRTGQKRTVAKTLIKKNTALTDTKGMSVVMREAIRRGFATHSPCERLGIPRDPPAEKPAITDEEVAKIREALRTKPEWMSTCFEIAMHQGCRLSETSLPLSNVSLETNEIQFKAKGRNGEPHVFTTYLHEGIRPLIARLKASGRKTTCDLPVMAAKEWHFFFKEIGLAHLCFHCTRVSVVTRMARAGVPIAKAMRFVGHANLLVHKIYQRLAPEDLECAAAAVSFSSDGSPQNQGGGRATTTAYPM